MAKSKTWTGMVHFQGKQLQAAVCARSAKRVAELCNEHCSGFASEGWVRGFWSNCGGNAAILEATRAQPDALLIATVQHPTSADQWRPIKELAHGNPQAPQEAR